MKQAKCDILIPIYNSPEWVKLCIYSLFKNTPKEYINKVFLLDDNSDELTQNLIINLKEKYGECIQVSRNESNLGFIKNVNKGFDMSEAEYILLLNTDCMVSKNTIPKLISHLQNESDVGLICPISSNAANISLDMYENYSFIQMNELLEKNFKGMNFKACTVVGNCLMITRECVKKVGHMDEIYGMGYGDETDYQFKAHSLGFEAKVAIDTYVFHKSEVSFGTSKEKQARINHNREIFFSRWGKEYNARMEEYVKNDPIEYINKNIKIPKKSEPNILFFLPDIHQSAGGVHVVVDIVNYLNINGVYANILTERIHKYDEIMLFKPSFMKNINLIKPKCIVGTIYPTIFFAETIAKHYDIPAVNFMQGYEPCFDNGTVYSWAELACKSSQNILAISNFLKEKCKNNFDKDAYVIPNGINIDLIYKDKETKNDKKTITMFLRGKFAKGDFILVDILKQLTIKCNNIKINIVHNEEIMKPINNNETIEINYIKGPISRNSVNNLLYNSDIIVDASLMEGFGLTCLEAMAFGVVPIMSESFGISEYAKNNENCFVINEVNNSDKYVEKIIYLLNNEEVLKKMSKNAKCSSKKFDIDVTVEKYIEYFSSVKKQEFYLTDVEKEEIKKWQVPDKNIFDVKVDKNGNVIPHMSFKRKVWLGFLKIVPKKLKSSIRNKIQRMLEY